MKFPIISCFHTEKGASLRIEEVRGNMFDGFYFEILLLTGVRCCPGVQIKGWGMKNRSVVFRGAGK